jgi:hypothetical protein
LRAEKSVHSAQGPAGKETKSQHDRQRVEKGKGGERRGGHVTEDITKNLTRKIGHGYCETAV